MYIIQVPNKNAPGQCGRAIIAPSVDWAEENLGGHWVQIKNPNEPSADNVVPYAGPGHLYDPGIPQKFVSRIWNATLAQAMQQAPDGTWFWEYNTFGELVWHSGRAWRNLMPTGTPNTWEPPTNWREYPLDNGVPLWIQPTGAIDAYPIGFVVRKVAGGDRFQSVIPDNTTEPGTDERWWTNLDYVAPDQPAPWVQPTGAHDAYNTGDQVLWTDGNVYASTIDANTYSPEAYPAGWQLV